MFVDMRPEKVSDSSGAGVWVIVSYLTWCWDPSLGPSKELCVLFTKEPSLQPSGFVVFLLVFCFSVFCLFCFEIPGAKGKGCCTFTVSQAREGSRAPCLYPSSAESIS